MICLLILEAVTNINPGIFISAPLPHRRLGAPAHAGGHNQVGFTECVKLSGGLIWPGLHSERCKIIIAPAFLHSPEITSTLSAVKICSRAKHLQPPKQQNIQDVSTSHQ